MAAKPKHSSAVLYAVFYEALYGYLCDTEVLKTTYNKNLITLLRIHERQYDRHLPLSNLPSPQLI